MLTWSIARPTRNVTGFTTGNETLAGKRLEILHEMVPNARKIALLWVLGNPQHRLVLERTREVAVALNIAILSLPVRRTFLRQSQRRRSSARQLCWLQPIQ